MIKKLIGLDPFIGPDAECLILGSMPSEVSIQKQQYYANPRNQFWNIMGALLGEDMSVVYPARLKILKKYKIALWDVIGSCERKGSLDAAIKRPVVNDIDTLLAKTPAIHTIGLNGKKAAQLFERQVDARGKRVIVLPSSSPAHAIPLKQKVEIWKALM